MDKTSSRLSLIFSSIGHTYIHMFTAFYFTIVIAIEGVWDQPFHELIQLWTPAAFLVGVLALPAGWAADRWSAAGMMVIFFLGMGVTAILSGLAGGPISLLPAMAGIGAFAAIYHPVGIPWVIRSARRSVGMALAINGVFGGLGVGLGALVAAGLIDLVGWRAAFIVPGVFCLITGLVMLGFVATGRIKEAPVAAIQAKAAGRGGLVKAVAILLLAVSITGIIFQSMQTVMPKLFAARLADYLDDSVFGVGFAVFAVYGVSAFAQLLGGVLSDRVPLKLVYLMTWIVQAPLLWLMAQIGGAPAVLFALILVSSNTASLPAENLLLAHFTPAKHHGLAFGVKFVLAFGLAPLAIELVALIQRRTGGFDALFLILGVAAVAVIVFVGLLLPSVGSGRKLAQPVAAE